MQTDDRKPMHVTLDPIELRGRLADAVQTADVLRRLLKIAESAERKSHGDRREAANAS